MMLMKMIALRTSRWQEGAQSSCLMVKQLFLRAMQTTLSWVAMKNTHIKLTSMKEIRQMLSASKLTLN